MTDIRDSSVQQAKAAATAETIWALWSKGEVTRELPEAVRPRSLQEAWEAQAALVPLAGDMAGWKIAATSEAGQASLAVDAPLPGRLFERFVHSDSTTLSAEGMHMRLVEAEFAFRIGTDLPAQTPIARDEVLGAVEALHLAIEIPDSRFERFEGIGPENLIADNACAGRFVLGSPVSNWASFELSEVPVTMAINGLEVAVGSGGAVLGDPRTALVWLANELARFGVSLEAGMVVTTGTTTVPPPVSPGDQVVATFGDLGSVSVSFSEVD